MKDSTARSHRELEILDALRRLGGSARSADLAAALEVSEETVRRAIKALAKTGAVVKVHGGAYLAGAQNDPSFFRRITQHADEKRMIAAEVVKQVRDGMTLFLDVGSTTAFVAEELRRHSNLTIATNSIGVAQTLVNINGNRVHLLGGEMQSDERGAFGHVTEQQARRFAYDFAVLSADALSAKRGFLYLNPAEATLANVVAEWADRTLVALAHYKFQDTAPHCGPDVLNVDDMVTDKVPDKKLASALQKWGVETHLVTEGMGDVGNN